MYIFLFNILKFVSCVLILILQMIVLRLTKLSNFTFTFHFHALEKDMATHSSVLAWVGCHLWGCTESDTTEVT